MLLYEHAWDGFRKKKKNPLVIFSMEKTTVANVISELKSISETVP